MKDLLVVMSFTIKDMVKRKSFIISTLIILLLIVLGFNIPNIISAIAGEGDSSSQNKILIVDSQNVFQRKLRELKSNGIGIYFWNKF